MTGGLMAKQKRAIIADHAQQAALRKRQARLKHRAAYERARRRKIREQARVGRMVLAPKTNQAQEPDGLRAQVESLTGELRLLNDQYNKLSTAYNKLSAEERAGTGEAQQQLLMTERRLRALEAPAQTRRVVRTVITEGVVDWVAGTLLKSLKAGRTRMGDHNSITVVVESDVTTDARNLDTRGLGQFGDERR